MEIRQLRTFRTVAQLLSFNRAADHLHYAQSSISAQIQALEADLDVQLFDRLGRRITLTEAGARLLEYADKILELAEETRAEVAEARKPQGTLTIRIPESFGVYRLSPIIKKFRSHFPNVGLRFHTCAHEGLQKDLRKGITDLAFLLAESFQAGDLGVEAVGFESIVMVAHPDAPLAAKKSVQTRDLEGETMLLSKVDCSYRRMLQQMVAGEKVSLDTRLEFNSVAVLKQCVMEGVGITVLPEVAVEKEIKSGMLKLVPWVDNEFEVAVLMIWYKERWLSPTLLAFMDAVREGLQDG